MESLKGKKLLILGGSAYMTESVLKAKSMGINLNKSTIELLQGCNYGQHIKPISVLEYHDTWKVALVKYRTNAMLDIIYDKLTSWL